MQVCTSSQTTTPTSHHSVFTGRMPFLPPNQQRQSTEGNLWLMKCNISFTRWHQVVYSVNLRVQMLKYCILFNSGCHHQICCLSTPWAIKKTCHFTLDYNFRISWWISTLCAPMVKGINILPYDLLMQWFLIGYDVTIASHRMSWMFTV